MQQKFRDEAKTDVSLFSAFCPTCPNKTMWRAVLLKMDYSSMNESKGVMTVTEYKGHIWSLILYSLQCEDLSRI